MAARAKDELLHLSGELKSIRHRKRWTKYEAAEAVWPDIEEVQTRVKIVSNWEAATARPSPELLTQYLDVFARDDDEWVRIWKLAGYSHLGGKQHAERS